MNIEAIKVDRRIQRTRQQLRDALIALIVEKGYDTLSIQDITDRANVNRTTFYLHFRDKEDLLINSMQELYDELVQHFMMPSREELLTLGVNTAMCDPSDYQHVAQHADFYRVMLGTRGVASFVTRVRAYLAHVNAEWLATLLLPGETPHMPLEMIAYALAGMQIGAIAWWLENGMPYTAEQMARMGGLLSGFGTWQALGLTVPMPDFEAFLKADAQSLKD